jgi:hypothetical protein
MPITDLSYEKMSEHFGNTRKPVIGNSCYYRFTWEEACFNHSEFKTFVLEQIGYIPTEWDKEYTLYNAVMNSFEKDKKQLKSFFLGKNKNYLKEILESARGIISLEAKFGQTENGKTEDYIEYKISLNSIYAKNVLLELFRCRMYKVIWDYYVNYKTTAGKCWSRIHNQWIPGEEYDEEAEKEEVSRRKLVAIEAKKKARAKSLMPPPLPKKKN